MIFPPFEDDLPPRAKGEEYQGGAAGTTGVLTWTPAASSILALMARWLILAAAVWLLWRWLKQRIEPVTGSSPRTAGWDPHAILGLRRGASADEVTRAYREQIKLYHPDRVADLGEELRRVAHEKTVAIQRAYEELSRSR
jgi:preprotein translocase subunit Sec63